MIIDLFSTVLATIGSGCSAFYYNLDRYCYGHHPDLSFGFSLDPICLLFTALESDGKNLGLFHYLRRLYWNCVHTYCPI